jgi:hypothetical protein
VEGMDKGGIEMKHKNLFTCLFLAGGLLVGLSPVLAHHSPSEQDRTRVITLTGTVTKWALINPHGLLSFEVVDENGNVEAWIGTGGAPNHMKRVGWTAQTVKPGDKVIVVGHPYKDGRKLLYFTSVTLPDGTKIGSVQD